MAAIVQTTDGAKPVGDFVEQQASGTIFETGGWFHGERQREDVCGEE